MTSLAASNKRVMILASHAPSLTNFRGPLIAELVRRGWHVSAAAPDFDDSSRAGIAELGARPLDVGMARVGMNPFRDFAYFLALVALFRRQRPDVLVAYTIKPVIWGLLAARVARVPRAIALITGLGYAFAVSEKPEVRQAVAGWIARLLYRLALPRADAVLFQNPDDRDLFRELGFTPFPDRVRITAGSGVDLSHFQAAAIPSKLSFLMLARLLVAKGVREYAAASCRLKRRYPGVEFRLAGGLDAGPGSITEEELETVIDSGVVYLGSLSDVRPALAEASVYVLPSFYREGTPRSILEALATGRAVITTDMPGCRETVENGKNGFLIPARNDQALEHAMEKFILDPGLVDEMGSQSLRLARRKYDVKLVNRMIIEAIEEGRHGREAARP